MTNWAFTTMRSSTPILWLASMAAALIVLTAAGAALHWRLGGWVPNYPWYSLVLVPFLALSPLAVAWVLTSVGVLFYNVVPNDSLPAYEVRIAIFILAVVAALAHDLWAEWRTTVPVGVGETT